MTKIDMIGESIEDKKIMEGIKENFIRTRELDAKRKAQAKRDKIETFFAYLILGVLTYGGMTLLGIFIGLIENWNF
jgi:hypothetical protein